MFENQDVFFKCEVCGGRFVVGLVSSHLKSKLEMGLSCGSKTQHTFRPFRGDLSYLEEVILYQALIMNKWNKTRTAAELGISINTLERRIKLFGLSKTKHMGQLKVI